MAKKHKRETKSHKKSKNKSFASSNASAKGKKGKLEIKFDPMSRKEYLTGFSARKKERRAFGLAMQKVKDRKAKLEEKKESKELRDAQVLEMESQKRKLSGMEEHVDYSDSEEFNIIETNNHEEIQKGAIVAEDSQFGDDVIVTTTFGLPEVDDNDGGESMPNKHKIDTKGADIEQKMSGSLKHMIEEVRKSGILTNKTKSNTKRNTKRKGSHGASVMKGVGGTANFKAAMKTLSIVQAKNAGNKKGGRKNKQRMKR